ncbi:MAG: hypothetical protein KGL39_15350 [Patescibacteria group bacterium]|nr:hypothetical protein [Patescibacteria group bacterium]
MDLLKYLPHAAIVALASFLAWKLKRYAEKLDRMIENGATKSDVRNSEMRMEGKLTAARARLDEDISELRQDQRDRDDRLEKRIDDGFRGIHERIDKILDRKG